MNNKVAESVKDTLEAMGIDLTDENFKDTPNRVARAYGEILMWQDDIERQNYIETILQKSFPTTYHGIVAQKNIKTVSMCPHHMQPIQYSIDIGYVADKKALGLSKLVRIADTLSGRMVLQETLTEEIARVFYNQLMTKGVIVIVRGKHGCMTNRGVKQDVVTTTSTVLGIFEKDTALRQEFLALNT